MGWNTSVICEARAKYPVCPSGPVVCDLLFLPPFFLPINILKFSISLPPLFPTYSQTATSFILSDVQHSACSLDLSSVSPTLLSSFRYLGSFFPIALWEFTTDFLVLKGSGLCFKHYLFEPPTAQLEGDFSLLEPQWEQNVFLSKELSFGSVEFHLAFKNNLPKGMGNIICLLLFGPVFLSECHPVEISWICR